jgi:ribose transport system ATP-binding protein
MTSWRRTHERERGGYGLDHNGEHSPSRGAKAGMSLRVTGLTKSFGGARALGGVDLDVPAGQVHALLGHNGAGKSTLIRCLGGGHPPDAGTMEINGVPYTRLTPRESIAAGIAVIYQNLSVVAALTAAENIFLGQEWHHLGVIKRRSQEELAASLLQRVGARCSPRARVADLPMGQRQLVEIAKALSRSAGVLILDEPTAALSRAESDALADRVAELRTQDLAIVYVTHLLPEVERLADAVTVLRDGMVSYTSPTRAQTRSQLVAAISGHRPPTPRDPTHRAARTPSTTPSGSAAGNPTRMPLAGPTGPSLNQAPVQPGGEQIGLETTKADVDETSAGPLSLRGGGSALELVRLAGPGLGPVDLRVAPGEIVGLYGLIGSGRTRLLETVAGRRRPGGGRIVVAGRPLTARRPASALARGVALVPADRRGQALFAQLSALDNMLLPAVPQLARWGLRARSREVRAFAGAAAAVGLRPAAPALPAAAFSGGNQQKLILARWLAGPRPATVLLLDEPTQGVDVGAREEIYQTLAALAADHGTAILFASTDPEEVTALAHRCLLMSNGRITHELTAPDITEPTLLTLAHAAADPGRRPHSAEDSR